MYNSKNILSSFKNSNLLKVVIGICSVWVLGAILISLIEPGPFDLKNSLWWAIVTMTTVGYGDMAPSTDLGRAIAIIIMFSGIILIAIITATISSTVITKKIMEGKGLEKINLTDHIIICGWNSNIFNLIKGLDSKKNIHKIVLVNNQPQNDIDNIVSSFSSVKFVRGDYSLDAILSKANAIKAKYALILNDINEDEKTGSRSRLLRFDPGVYTTKPFVHDHWEEVFLVKGDLIVGNDENGKGGEKFDKSTFACRPPGVYHGPFKSDYGCTLFELHYYINDKDF